MTTTSRSTPPLVLRSALHRGARPLLIGGCKCRMIVCSCLRLVAPVAHPTLTRYRSIENRYGVVHRPPQQRLEDVAHRCWVYTNTTDRSWASPKRDALVKQVRIKTHHGYRQADTGTTRFHCRILMPGTNLICEHAVMHGQLGLGSRVRCWCRW